MLITGLILGLFPRFWPVFGVVASGIIWAAILTASDVVSGPTGILSGCAAGIANAAIGAIVSTSIRRIIQILTLR